MRRLPTLLASLVAGMVAITLAPLVEAGLGHNHIVGFDFSPDPMTVIVGDTVKWHNHDGATHTATDVLCARAGGPGPCEFDSFNMATGAVFSHTFNSVASFSYKCTIHNFFGVLNVVAQGGGADLQITAVTFFDPIPGVQKRVNVTVTNAGDAAAGASRVNAQYMYKNVARAIGTANLGALAVGGSETVSVLWNTAAKIGDFEVVVQADDLGQVAEVSNHNNDGSAIASVLLPPGTLPGKDLTNP